MTEDPKIRIKFEGGDADYNVVDMRLLGRSLIGYDRIISDGVILLCEGRQPRRGERAPLIAKAQEARPGSHETVTVLQEHAGMLGLGWTLFKDSGGEIIWNWIKFVIELSGGNKDKADKALGSMLQMNRDHLSAKDTSDERITEMIKNVANNALGTAERLGLAAIQAAAPVGPSARSASIRTDRSELFEIDEALADAIRAKGQFEVSEMQELILTADGWTYHSRVLNVHHPEHPGRFLSAKVRDPLGEVDGNDYADAARDKATIIVQGKLARRAGEIEKIYIMDYRARRNNAA